MKLRMLIIDEDRGEVVMHGPVESYDLRRDYDRYYGSAYGPPVYMPRPSRVEVVCSHVISGPPAVPVPGTGRPHNFGPVTDLVQVCKDCGYRQTLVALLMGYSAKPCPGPKTAVVPGNTTVIIGTPQKSPSYNWTVVKKRDDPQPDRWVKFPVPGGCECGSAKAGLPTHSTWCPKAKT